MKKLISILKLSLILVFTGQLAAQELKHKSASDIYEELEKFNFLGSALYVAAHPDDENTRLISYLSNHLHARTAYLSLTRGDGGQNLIGTEIRELLGVIRSQELQMARATDGGQQFFTRANDFGYSKHPDETLKIWNKEQVFEDMIYAIRSFEPDIIINRFDHRTPGKTHGHHTSSAMLSVEAFDAANDPTVYPKQLKSLKLWQTKRQYMNTSWWFYGSREKFAEADKTNLVGIDAGVYYPSRGISNGEISSFARSKHLSQGFGSSGGRGSYQEWLELINGDMPSNKENLFDGINTTWTRVKGGEPINDLMAETLNEFDFRAPSESVNNLLSIYDVLKKMPDDGHWKEIKLKHLSEIIVECMGLHLEAATEMQQATPGDSIEIQIEATNRSSILASISSVSLNNKDTDINGALEENTQSKWFKNFGISQNTPFSNPYWLNEKGTLGTYKVDNPKMRNLPQSPAAFEAEFQLDIEGRKIQVTKDVIYRYVDPAKGEIRQPFVITPAATMSFSKDMYLFAEENTQTIEVTVRAGKDNLKGKLKIDHPKEWVVTPSFFDVDIDRKAKEEVFNFTLTAPKKVSEGHLKAVFQEGETLFDKTMISINYDHIPLQTVLLPAESKVVKVPLKTGGKNIGYVMGAGDKMPESLGYVGYNVTLIEPSTLNTANISGYDAIVIGIRAYNALKNLKLYNEKLFGYAENGGTLITQYNTSRRLNFDDLAPYPLKLSRKRVTDEYAEVRLINPKHKALNYPNKITSKDFDGWVQERGLYFPEEWDSNYETIISSNDKGEDPLDGSILIAKHGKGYFVYTGISWFRELPAGVPGAYRLFANLLALSQNETIDP